MQVSAVSEGVYGKWGRPERMFAVSGVAAENPPVLEATLQPLGMHLRAQDELVKGTRGNEAAGGRAGRSVMSRCLRQDL